MTIAVSSARATALSGAGQSNRPFFSDEAFTGGTFSTDIGTQVLAAANAATASTYDAWTATPDGSSEAALAVQYGAAVEPTFAAIVAHNIADVSGTVSVQYSTDGGTSWTDSGAGTVTPSDNQAIGWRFVATSAADWRVLVTGATDDVAIAVAYFGTEIILPQGLYQGYSPPITPTEVDLRTNITEGQNYVASASVERGSTWTAQLTEITPTFLRGATWSGFQRRWNKGEPAFWAWRPTKYGDLLYSWRRGAAMRPNNAGPKDYMAFTVEARAYDKP